MIGNPVGSYNDLVELTTLAAQGVRLRTRVYALDDAVSALHDLDQGAIPGGRAILVPEA